MDAYERIEKATQLCSEAVHGIKSDQLSDPTPCSEFNVKDLLNHIIAGLGMLHTAATGGKATPPQDNIVTDDFKTQYDEGRNKLLDALKDPAVFDRTWEMPFGAMPGKMMAGIAFLEHTAHAWDVRKATGQPTDLPSDVIEELDGVVRPMDQMLRMPGVCGPALPVSEDASATDKLMGFLGRQP